jgi:ATP-binding cassette, subfamily B, bacterial PglK
MMEQVRKVLSVLDSGQRRRWMWLVPLAVASGAFEAIATAAVFGLIQQLANPARLERLGGFVFGNRAAGADPPFSAAVLGGIVVCVFVIKNALRLSEIYWRGHCAAKSGSELAAQLLRNYLAAPYTFHLSRNSAQLFRNVEVAADTVLQASIAPATAIASNLIVITGVLLVLVLSTPSAALGAASVIALVLVAALRMTARYQRRLGVRAHELRASATQSLQQSLGAVKEVTILGRAAFFADAYARRRSALSQTQLVRLTLQDSLPAVVETVFMCGVAVLLVVARYAQLTNVLPLLGLFSYAGLRIMPSLGQVMGNINMLRFGQAAVDEIHREFHSLKDYQAERERSGAVPPLPFRDQIVVRDVAYTYPGSSHAALHEINFSIRRGEVVGIVGPSAAGKSTLVDVVLGLLVPDAGSIMVDGIAIQKNLAGWQRQIGYVPQAVYFTDDTIRGNVAFGLPDREIDDARVQAAIRRAQIDALIARLPAGLDTIVGERGVRLSGGERQRLAVARALYHEPEILVFDEATSALDEETEQDLAAELDRLRGQKTLIVIAHRPATIRRCDRLVRLDQGTIRTTGLAASSAADLQLASPRG